MASLPGTSALLFLLSLCLQSWVAAGGCYSALFSFGTSLSDTGNAIKTSPIFFTSVLLPYGETYFNRAAGRYSDGRIFLDYLAQSIGLPLLNPYLAYKGKKGVDFTYGVNYAVSGATAEGPGFLLSQGGITFLTFDSLDVQLGWHFGIQDMAEGRMENQYPAVKLPSPDVFAKALYYIEIGGNDYGTLIFSKHLLKRAAIPISVNDAISSVSAVVKKNLDAIEAIYQRGGKNFFLYAQAPEGCAPLYLRYLNGTKDVDGCLDAFNQIDIIHNEKLLEGVQALEAKYPDIRVMIGDAYKAYKEVLQSPSSYGFANVKSACCGAGPSQPYGFSLLRACSPLTYKCPNPHQYLTWDGIHPTDAYNRYLINSFTNGRNIIPANGLSSCASPVP